MMNQKKDLSKELLYQSVKTLIEEEHPHLHLHQHKLFTLFSIALQYFFFYSTKRPGIYILRIEDSFLAEKLSKKAKDPITRKFLEKLILPRKLPYGKSTFYLDYFNINSWFFTNELPRERIQGALIVKDSTTRPLQENMGPFENEVDVPPEVAGPLAALPPDYYFVSLQEFIPKSLIISFENNYPNTKKLAFPFIKDQEKSMAEGVTLSPGLNLDDLNND